MRLRTRSPVICVLEGYATGWTVWNATGCMTVAALHAGNLQAVAQALRNRYPLARFLFGADDDLETARSHPHLGNPGLKCSRVAAESVCGRVAIPDFGSTRPRGATDFNDLEALSGTSAVRQIVVQALGDWLEGPGICNSHDFMLSV